MKKVFLMFTAFIFVSCSTFNVETEINGSALKNYKKSGILFRSGGLTTVLTNKEYAASLRIWSDGYKKKNEIMIVENASDKLSTYDSDINRFYQTSEDNSFLTPKFRGVIASYYRNNVDELKGLIKSYELDSIIICEIESYYSESIQKFGFDSVMVVLDAEGNISYLDHQSDSFKVEEFFPDSEKNRRYLSDKVSNRIIENLLKFGYIEEKNF